MDFGEVLALVLVVVDVQVADNLAVKQGAGEVRQLQLSLVVRGAECNGKALDLYEFKVF